MLFYWDLLLNSRSQRWHLLLRARCELWRCGERMGCIITKTGSFSLVLTVMYRLCHTAWLTTLCRCHIPSNICIVKYVANFSEICCKFDLQGLVLYFIQCFCCTTKVEKYNWHLSCLYFKLPRFSCAFMCKVINWAMFYGAGGRHVRTLRVINEQPCCCFLAAGPSGLYASTYSPARWRLSSGIINSCLWCCNILFGNKLLHLE